MLRIQLIPLFFLISVLGFSQSAKPIDSLEKVLENQPADTNRVGTLSRLYNAYLYNDPDKAYHYIHEALELSTSLEFESGIVNSLYLIGVYHANQSNVDSGMYYYQKASDILEGMDNPKMSVDVKHAQAILAYDIGNYDQSIALVEENIDYMNSAYPDSLRLAMALDFMGGIYIRKGFYNLAFQNILKGLRIFEKLDNEIRLADAYNRMGNAEFQLGNFIKSIEYNNLATVIYEDHGDKYFLSQALNDMGNTYYYMEKYDSAEVHLEQALPLAREMNAGDLIATILGNLGKVRTKTGEFQRARIDLEEALELVEANQARTKNSEICADLGILYNEMGQPSRAIPYLNRSLEIAREIKGLENLRISYFNRSVSYEKLGQTALALADYREHKIVGDSIYSREKSYQIQELRTIYETEKKEQEIVLQEREIQVLEQRARISSQRNIIIVLSLIAVVITLGLLFYGIRQKYKRTQLEKEKLDAELDYKKKELTTYTLHLAHKNEVLKDIRDKAEDLKTENSSGGYRKLISTINSDLRDDNNWENFKRYFEEVHKDFSRNVIQNYPDLTPNELRMMALLKMNLSSKEIASILNISQEGIKKARQRLRKKLNIQPEISLQEVVVSIR